MTCLIEPFGYEIGWIPSCIRLAARSIVFQCECDEPFKCECNERFERKYNELINRLALVSTRFHETLALSENAIKHNIPPRWVTLTAVDPGLNMQPSYVSCLRMSGPFSKEQFLGLVSRYPHVEHLCGYTTIDNDDLAILADGCTKLTHLNLADCIRITDVGLVILAARCPKLTHLNLAGCSHVTGAGLASMADGCPKLTHLNLAGCIRITGADLAILADGCHELTHLDLSGCPEIGNGIESLTTGCPNITTLDVTDCDKIGDTVLAHMVVGLKLLRDLIGCNIVSHEAYNTVHTVLLGRYHLFSDND